MYLFSSLSLSLGPCSVPCFVPLLSGHSPGLFGGQSSVFVRCCRFFSRSNRRCFADLPLCRSQFFRDRPSSPTVSHPISSEASAEHVPVTHLATASKSVGDKNGTFPSRVLVSNQMKTRITDTAASAIEIPSFFARIAISRLSMNPISSLIQSPATVPSFALRRYTSAKTAAATTTKICIRQTRRSISLSSRQASWHHRYSPSSGGQ